MRRHIFSRLDLSKKKPTSGDDAPTDHEIARRAMVLSFGPRTAGWLLRQHRKQFHEKGVVDFLVPEKPTKILAEKLRWFFIAMAYLQQKDVDGDRLRAAWEVEVFVKAKGKRTFRVRWVDWKRWKREPHPFGPS